MKTMLMPTSPVIPERPDLHEVQIAKDQPDYLCVPAHVMHDGHCVTRWQLTPEQRAAVAGGADVVVVVQAPLFGPTPFFPPVSVHAGRPEWIGEPAPPEGDGHTLPAPALRIAHEDSTPATCKLELEPAPGTRLADIGMTIFVIATDEAFRDCRLPYRAQGVWPVLTLQAAQLERGVPVYVRAYYVPREERALQPSAPSAAVTVMFPPDEEPAPEEPPAEGEGAVM